MRIKIGLGNSVTTTYDKVAKTVTFTGAYNWDIDPTSVEIYDTTISAWILGNGATVNTAVTATIAFSNTATVHPLQVLTLSEIFSASANGDTLAIYCECPNDVALYNATVSHA